MAEALYTIDILRLAAATGQWPRLASPEGSAERRSPTCGSRVEVDIMLDAAGAVSAIGLSVTACALGQASATILASAAEGRDAAAIRSARNALADYLGGRSDILPDWPNAARLVPARDYPARHPSILLAFDATLAAMDDALAVGRRAHG